MQTILFILSLFIAQPSDSIVVDNYTGKWNYEVEAPDMTYKGIMVINKEDGEYSGTMSAQGVEIELKDLEIEDDEMTCNMNVQGFACKVTATFDGDKLSGKVALPDMGLELPLKGSRAE